MGQFSLNVNLNKETIYIVDEASLISNSGSDSTFGSGHLLDDLVEYVYSNDNNKLILVGDSAQLPPVGLAFSDALNPSFVQGYGDVVYSQLQNVVRQSKESGILYNATILRKMIENGDVQFPKFELDRFDDIQRIGGGDLIEELNSAFEREGADNTLVLCRSNKRANRYNKGIRASILFREERLCRGDKVMVVKNCYQFIDDVEEIGFIANGDVAELLKISNYEDRYGLTFADAVLRFMDYSHIKTKRKRVAAVREDKYFNALQIKFASAITCHKSQGGQWNTIFIDNPFWGQEITADDLKWLYTAITRATGKIFFVNFEDKFFVNK